MSFQPLQIQAPLADYERESERLLAAQRARDPDALAFFLRHHPRFRREGVTWLPQELTAAELAREEFELEDARLAIARLHDFADWSALAEWALQQGRGGERARFESAVEAVIDGRLETLEQLLRHDLSLAQARSTRRTPFDPPVHRATLLHYVAANGVEGYRQRCPRSAPAIARALLEAGAAVDALASLYGGECATLSLLVSSSHPAQAGVQVELVELLLDHGAAIEGCGERWGSPLLTALVFGFPAAAEVLARRGARVDGVAAAAGLGRVDELRRALDEADAGQRHLALALAAQLGRLEALRFLLDAGEDPDRYAPEGAHAHATALHQAALAGHLDVVRLLVERGARLDLTDKLYSGTPREWAEHAGRAEVAAWLRANESS